MVTFLPEDLYEAGASVSNFQKGLATSVANTVCSLYQAAPRGFVPNPVGGAIGSIARGYWDSFCGRLPEPKLPAPPIVPFVGGRCSVSYLIQGTYQSISHGCTQRNWNAVLPGPGFSVFSRGGNWYVKNDAGVESTCNDPTMSFQGIKDRQPVPGGCDYYGASSGEGNSLVITSVSRLDGQPDSCGSNPPQYPSVALPSASNPGSYTYPSPGDSPPTVNYSIDFDPSLIVPIVNVDLNGELEIPVSFDAGGITLELPDFNIGGEGDGGGLSPEQVQALLDAASKIPGIQDGLNDLTKNGDTTQDDTGEQEGDAEGDEPNIAGILVTITNIPLGAGRKFGTPQLFDFGRAHFRRGLFYSEEIRLTTVRQWCPAPADATGYAVQLGNGVKANITVVKQVKENGG